MDKDKAIITLSPAEIKKQEKAHMNYIEIRERMAAVGMNFIELGRLLKICRDKKYYKVHNHDTFESFLGSLEVGVNYKTAYSFIHIYELYVEKLNINKEFLAQIRHAKLQAINPVVERNPQEWLFKAKELSKSDIINEVRIAQNKPEKEYPITKGKPQLFDFDNYLDFIKAYGCITCSDTRVAGAHFPKTDKAGAPDHWRIPLCQKCHDLYHHDPIDFIINYRDNWAEFFYDLIIAVYKLTKEK